MNLKIKGTNVLKRNLQAATRVIVNEGGSRSSKTYSIAQKFIINALRSRGEVITIARKTLPSLKQSVFRDFIEILETHGLYDDSKLNKSDLTYRLNGNLFEFISMDQPQKKRGSKRDKLWMNEANEFSFEDYQQLIMRTTGEVTLDYNPSDVDHWIYNKVIPREDCTFIRSTYLDNPFLEDSVVKEIELLQEIDPTYWKIYGLGQRAIPENVIFPRWDLFDTVPEGCTEIYGLDFGFNNPTALVRINIKERDVYLEQLIYQTRMTNGDLIKQLETVIPNRYSFIYADCAEPARIEEIFRADFNIMPADKSVKDGIDYCKRFNLHLRRGDEEMRKEFSGYKYKEDKNGNVLDEPVKFKDHTPDSFRYALYTYGINYIDMPTLTIGRL